MPGTAAFIQAEEIWARVIELEEAFLVLAIGAFVPVGLSALTTFWIVS